MPRRSEAIGFGCSMVVLVTTLAAQVPQPVAPQRGAASTAPCGSTAVPPGYRCFELRTYAVDPSRTDVGSPAAIVRKEIEILRKSGATLVGVWQQLGQTGGLIYMVSFPDGAQRETAWATFNNDPEWQRLKTEYVVPQTTGVMFMTTTGPIMPVLFGDPSGVVTPSPGRGAGPGQPGGTVAEPRLLSQTQPEYTQEAREARIRGTVEMLIVVKEDGTAEFQEFRRKLGYGLDEKAVEAVQKWRFSPGRKDGKPVRTYISVMVNFDLR